MSQTTFPSAPRIFQDSGAARKPFFSSSKSRSSANGRPPRASRSTFSVCSDGGLPLGWKCPTASPIGCGSGGVAASAGAAAGAASGAVPGVGGWVS